MTNQRVIEYLESRRVDALETARRRRTKDGVDEFYVGKASAFSEAVDIVKAGSSVSNQAGTAPSDADLSAPVASGSLPNRLASLLMLAYDELPEEDSPLKGAILRAVCPIAPITAADMTWASGQLGADEPPAQLTAAHDWKYEVEKRAQFCVNCGRDPRLQGDESECLTVKSPASSDAY